MFSVKIDKLVAMNKNEKSSYAELADSILKKTGDHCRSIAIVNGGTDALKIASALVGKLTEKILFVDGDTGAAEFLGKYKLGRDLQGLTEAAAQGQTDQGAICVTSNPYLDLLFTGNAELVWTEETKKRVQKMLEDLEEEYTCILAASDAEGHMAACCDAAILVIPEAEYSEETAQEQVRKLDQAGCYVMGVMLHE